MIISVKSRNGPPHQIDIKAAKFSGTLKDSLELLELDNDEVISLDGIEDHVLREIIVWLEYCEVASKPNKSNDEEMQINHWKDTFFRQNNDMLIELLEGASYLDIQNLLDITSQLLANKISGKSLDSIRAEFNIIDDFTPEQKDIIRRENDLCGVPRL